MIVEEYVNKNGHVSQRCLVHPEIMIGGFVLDRHDWLHLHDDLGVRSVLNVCTDQSDEGKGIQCFAECRVPDDGQPFSVGTVRHAVSFAQLARGLGRIYVHCALGNSLSPAFAYAILRWVFRQSSSDALKAIREGKPKAANYGHHAYHKSYLDSVEASLRMEPHLARPQFTFVPCGAPMVLAAPWET